MRLALVAVCLATACMHRTLAAYDVVGSPDFVAAVSAAIAREAPALGGRSSVTAIVDPGFGAATVSVAQSCDGPQPQLTFCGRAWRSDASLVSAFPTVQDDADLLSMGITWSGVTLVADPADAAERELFRDALRLRGISFVERTPGALRVVGPTVVVGASLASVGSFASVQLSARPLYTRVLNLTDLGFHGTIAAPLDSITSDLIAAPADPCAVAAAAAPVAVRRDVLDGCITGSLVAAVVAHAAEPTRAAIDVALDVAPSIAFRGRVVGPFGAGGCTSYANAALLTSAKPLGVSTATVTLDATRRRDPATCRNHGATRPDLALVQFLGDAPYDVEEVARELHDGFAAAVAAAEDTVGRIALRRYGPESPPPVALAAVGSVGALADALSLNFTGLGAHDGDTTATSGAAHWSVLPSQSEELGALVDYLRSTLRAGVSGVIHVVSSSDVLAADAAARLSAVDGAVRRTNLTDPALRPIVVAVGSVPSVSWAQQLFAATATSSVFVLSPALFSEEYHVAARLMPAASARAFAVSAPAVLGAGEAHMPYGALLGQIVVQVAPFLSSPAAPDAALQFATLLRRIRRFTMHDGSTVVVKSSSDDDDDGSAECFSSTIHIRSARSHVYQRGVVPCTTASAGSGSGFVLDVVVTPVAIAVGIVVAALCFVVTVSFCRGMRADKDATAASGEKDDVPLLYRLPAGVPATSAMFFPALLIALAFIVALQWDRNTDAEARANHDRLATAARAASCTSSLLREVAVRDANDSVALFEVATNATCVGALAALLEARTEIRGARNRTQLIATLDSAADTVAVLESQQTLRVAEMVAAAAALRLSAGAARFARLVDDVAARRATNGSVLRAYAPRDRVARARQSAALDEVRDVAGGVATAALGVAAADASLTLMRDALHCIGDAPDTSAQVQACVERFVAPGGEAASSAHVHDAAATLLAESAAAMRYEPLDLLAPSAFEFRAVDRRVRMLIWFAAIVCLLVLVASVAHMAIARSFYRATQQTQATEDAISRFVPLSMLQLGNLDSLHDVELGAPILRDMVAVYVRVQTAGSSAMLALDAVRAMGARLTKIADEYDGMIEHVVGDGALLLFRGVSGAVTASMCIVARITEDLASVATSSTPVSVGVHRDTVCLGFIGCGPHTFAGAFCHALRIAQMLAHLADALASTVFVSQSTASQEAIDELYSSRQVGDVKSNRFGPIGVLDVFDPVRGGDYAEYKHATRDSFEDIARVQVAASVPALPLEKQEVRTLCDMCSAAATARDVVDPLITLKRAWTGQQKYDDVSDLVSL